MASSQWGPIVNVRRALGARMPAERLDDVLTGAGFEPRARSPTRTEAHGIAIRADTLADTVAAGLRVLICGLNPSRYSAERGVGFARPGNRFWPALVSAGLAEPAEALDARALLVRRQIGMTDLVKRATVASAELSTVEYRAGVERVERLVAWLRPGAVCFVGLEGYRKAVDRRAAPGPIDAGFGGQPAYLMPSTSGLNAHSRPADLAAHLLAASAAGPVT